jgi:hypothetical protein
MIGKKMKTMAGVPSKDSVAGLLARAHFKLEPGITRIFRLTGPDEDDSMEPIKLLEVNKRTVPVGIQPVQFGSHDASGIHYPSIIVDITPSEFQQVRKGTLPLPHGWRLDKEYSR